MQKRLAIGQGVKILDQKNRGGFNEPPPPPCQFKGYVANVCLKKKDSKGFEPMTSAMPVMKCSNY